MHSRTFLKFVVAATFCAFSWSAQAQTDVTIVTWGGNVATEMKKAWFEPATQGMNVRIRDDVLATYNDIRKHVSAGNVFWDVVDGATYQCEADGRDGFLEPLDFSVIKTDGLPKDQITKWSVPSTAFTMVLAYNKKKYKDHPPTSWKDFFDVKNFPGTRFLGPRATATLEIALLADGVPPEKLYPLDVDRAFKKLNEFKPSVTGFAASYGVSTQLINDGEADMLYLPDNRYFAAARAGANYGYTYNQGLMNFDCLVVPKGSKNKELAMKIINNVVSPEINARIVETSGLSPSNLLSVEKGFVPAKLVPDLATNPTNFSKIVMANNSWWVENQDKLRINERYNEYKGK
jgi:putative spermidine/putrescine transport system substrate-binding protein